MKRSSSESSKSKRDKEDHKEGSVNRSKEEKVSKEHRVVKEDKTVKEGKVQRSSESKRSGSSEKPHREDGKGGEYCPSKCVKYKKELPRMILILIKSF